MAHPANAWYGHDAILAAAAGVDEARPVLWGHLQHGWAPDWPLTDARRFAPWVPFFAWNERNAAACRDRGFRHVELIGSPFLYLLAGAGGATPVVPTGDTVFYPFHSTDRVAADGPEDELLPAVLEREGGPVTVCLYWTDHRDAAVRRRYEDAGFRVICHGQRNDPDMLHRQLATLQGARRVISNRVSTAVWYAAAMGREVEVYGPVFVPTGFDRQAYLDFDRQRWPEVVGRPLAGDDAVALAGRELGAAHLRAPDDLRRVLGLHRPRWQRRAYQAVVGADHQARRAQGMARQLVHPDTRAQALHTLGRSVRGLVHQRRGGR